MGLLCYTSASPTPRPREKAPPASYSCFSSSSSLALPCSQSKQMRRGFGGHGGHGGLWAVWLVGGGTGTGCGSCPPGLSWVLHALASAARR
eukprot:scaffold90856_cov19-Tisochrysis_lutea.AAC.1